MVRLLDPGDFRARRKILEPDDFALSDGAPDPSPTDLISEAAWDGIMTLPDDVAIRTTSHQGERIGLLHELWAGWIEVIPRRSIVADAMIYVADDFAAAIFNLVHGFYKQAINSLRSALEVTVLASDCALSQSLQRWREWENGADIRYADACKKLASNTRILLLEKDVRAETGGGILPDAGGNGIAWARNLYSRLSRFTHARGDSANSFLWESNGPIYSAEGMRVSYHLYLETYALLMILLKIAQNDVSTPPKAAVLFAPESIAIYCPEPFPAVCSAYSDALIQRCPK